MSLPTQSMARTPGRPPRSSGAPRARGAAAPPQSRVSREPIALAIAIHPPTVGRPWHAALVTADGRQQTFGSVTDLVQFLVALSLDSPPDPGLR